MKLKRASKRVRPAPPRPAPPRLARPAKTFKGKPPAGVPAAEVKARRQEPDIVAPQAAYKSDIMYLPDMPLQVRLLADSVMSDPRKALLTHAKVAGMTLQEAKQAMHRPDVKMYVGDVLDSVGATVEASCLAIANALVAEKIVATDKVFDAATGKLTMQHRTAPDHEYRLRAAELSLKLRGLLAAGDRTEEPLTLSALIMMVQQERERRGLEIPTQ